MKAASPLALLTFLLLAGTAQADDAKDEIVRLDREISVATWTGDAVWFEENVADEYQLITPSGVARGKKDVIREMSMPGLHMEPYEPFDVQVRVYGDAAVVTGRVLQKFKLGGVGYTRDVRYTDIYVRRKSRWILVSGHASAVAGRR